MNENYEVDMEGVGRMYGVEYGKGCSWCCSWVGRQFWVSLVFGGNCWNAM